MAKRGHPLATQELLNKYEKYKGARVQFLESIKSQKKKPISLRDPLSVFSEELLASIICGNCATNDCQRGWDVEASGKKYEVKYLINHSEKEWKNEHMITRKYIGTNDEATHYAIVIFIDINPRYVFIFDLSFLDSLYDELGKRHGKNGEDRGIRLSFTRRNYVDMLAARSIGDNRFAKHGVEIIPLQSDL